MTASSPAPVCVEVLGEKVKSPVKNSKEGWDLLTQLAMCFVDISRTVHRLDEKVYGNGREGIAGQVEGLTNSVEHLSSLIGEIHKTIQAKKPQETEKKDWFELVTRYFIDKVLPALLISAIIWYIGFQVLLVQLVNSLPK